MATAPGPWSRWGPRVLVALIVIAALATALFGARTYRTFSLLRSAYELGVPELSGIRGWMTLRYVASTYRARPAALLERLGLPPQTDPDTTLRSLAARAEVSPPEYAQRVQRAVAELAPPLAFAREREATSPLGATGEALLGALLVYGYPALGLTLALGAMGVPLPSGLSMIVAGALAAQGRLSWPLASAIAVVASVLCDLAGYGIGLLLGGEFLERRGPWLGLTPERRARVDRLFHRWGGLSVLLSRSLVSFLSSAVNLVAGASRYRLLRFVGFVIAGRLVWTSAYLGVGYGVSIGLEPAADFLRSLTAFLVSLALLGGLGLAARRRASIRT